MELGLVIIGSMELVLTIVLFYVGMKVSKIDKLEETVTKKAEEVVETRFELLAQQIKGIAQQMQIVIGSIEKRLEKGDSEFDDQERAQHTLSLQTVNREAAIREWVLVTFGSREELAALSERLHQVDLRVTKFEAHLTLHKAG